MHDLWNRYQDWLYHHPGLGLYLDVSRMRFDPDLLDQLKPGFAKAFDAMEAHRNDSCDTSRGRSRRFAPAPRLDLNPLTYFWCPRRRLAPSNMK
jgi:hypothetical protein